MGSETFDALSKAAEEIEAGELEEETTPADLEPESEPTDEEEHDTPPAGEEDEAGESEESEEEPADEPTGEAEEAEEPEPEPSGEEEPESKADEDDLPFDIPDDGVFEVEVEKGVVKQYSGEAVKQMVRQARNQEAKSAELKAEREQWESAKKTEIEKAELAGRQHVLKAALEAGAIVPKDPNNPKAGVIWNPNLSRQERQEIQRQVDDAGEQAGRQKRAQLKRISKDDFGDDGAFIPDGLVESHNAVIDVAEELRRQNQELRDMLNQQRQEREAETQEQRVQRIIGEVDQAIEADPVLSKAPAFVRASARDVTLAQLEQNPNHSIEEIVKVISREAGGGQEEPPPTKKAGTQGAATGRRPPPRKKAPPPVGSSGRRPRVPDKAKEKEEQARKIPFGGNQSRSDIIRELTKAAGK